MSICRPQTNVASDIRPTSALAEFYVLGLLMFAAALLEMRGTFIGCLLAFLARAVTKHKSLTALRGDRPKGLKVCPVLLTEELPHRFNPEGEQSEPMCGPQSESSPGTPNTAKMFLAAPSPVEAPTKLAPKQFQVADLHKMPSAKVVNANELLTPKKIQQRMVQAVAPHVSSLSVSGEIRFLSPGNTGFGFIRPLADNVSSDIFFLKRQVVDAAGKWARVKPGDSVKVEYRSKDDTPENGRRVCKSHKCTLIACRVVLTPHSSGKSAKCSWRSLRQASMLRPQQVSISKKPALKTETRRFNFRRFRPSKSHTTASSLPRIAKGPSHCRGFSFPRTCRS